MSSFRNPAMAVSIVALVVAVAGGAFAIGAVISGASLQNGSVTVNKLAPTAQPIADPLTGQLHAGGTLRGMWNIEGWADKKGRIAGETISYPFRLAHTPTLNVIGIGGGAVVGSRTHCPGTSMNPQARRGNLCLYEIERHEIANGPAGGLEFFHQTAEGIILAAQSSQATAPTVDAFWIDGAWAVTGS